MKIVLMSIIINYCYNFLILLKNEQLGAGVLENLWSFSIIKLINLIYN